MFLREFKFESIADLAIKFHKDLNPKIWENNHLIPEVQLQLMKIAKDFISFVNVPNIKIIDLTISGSNASYTYTDYSDIDLHIIAEFPFKRKEHLTELFNAKKNQYNTIHNITIKDIDVELYVQNSTEKHVSSGIYSILNDRWISEPKNVKFKIDDDEITEKAKNYLEKIKIALRSNNLSFANFIMNKIYRLRKTGLESAGEFSIENLSFKALRNAGWINKLREHIYDLEDLTLSLEDIKNEAKK